MLGSTHEPRGRSRAAALLAVFAMMPGPAFAAGDPDAGALAFARCAACHEISPTGASRVGPPLDGIVGRRAGSRAGFAYSRALAGAGANGLVWTEEALDDYLADPRRFVPGVRMAFPGIPDAATRSDIIAYLDSVERTGGTD